MGRLKVLTVRRCLAVVSMTALLFFAAAYLAYASGNVAPWWDTASAGGTRSSASFVLTDTTGQGVLSGVSRSQQFVLVSGFQAGTQSGSVQPPGPGTFNLTLSILGNGTTLPAAGVHNYPVGTSVNLTAAAAAGWTFGYWSGDASGTAALTSLTMNDHKSITANFAPQGVTLIGAIRQNPVAYENRAIKISGQYRGWEAGHGSPPVTRGDWVLQDSTGSIYVTGNSLGLRNGRDQGKPVTVNGTVRIKSGVPYIDVSRIR